MRKKKIDLGWPDDCKTGEQRADRCRKIAQGYPDCIEKIKILEQAERLEKHGNYLPKW